MHPKTPIECRLRWPMQADACSMHARCDFLPGRRSWPWRRSASPPLGKTWAADHPQPLGLVAGSSTPRRAGGMAETSRPPVVVHPGGPPTHVAAARGSTQATADATTAGQGGGCQWGSLLLCERSNGNDAGRATRPHGASATSRRDGGRGVPHLAPPQPRRPADGRAAVAPSAVTPRGSCTGAAVVGGAPASPSPAQAPLPPRLGRKAGIVPAPHRAAEVGR